MSNQEISLSNGSCVTFYLILEEASTEGPDATEHKVEFIQFLGAVWRGRLRCQHTLQQVTQHLQENII